MKTFVDFVSVHERAKSFKRKNKSSKRKNKKEKSSRKKPKKQKMSIKKKLAVGAGAVVAGGMVASVFAKAHGRTIVDFASYLG